MMGISKIIILCLVFFAFLALFIFSIYDQHKVNMSYRNALDSIPQLHSDLVELVNTLKENFHG